MTLVDLKPGQRATIESIDTSSPGVCRLMVLGLIEGTPIEYRSSAIGGDPIEVAFFDISISLRLEQARCFTVQPVEDGIHTQ